ncbi:MAG: site-specific tyrosine recombinase/integron integrase [Thermodesulfobacteriota bacterium]
MDGGKEIDNAVKGFRRYLQYERNLSSNTVRAYMTDIRQFIGFVVKKRLNLFSMDLRDMNRYVESRFALNSKTSTERKLAAVRSFFRFMNTENMTDGNPAKSVKAPKKKKPLPSFLSVDEIDALMRVLQDREGSFHLRNVAMFELAYSCGLRVGELVSVKPDDLDFGQSTVRVMGKGGKQRVVPFGSKAASALKEYLPARGEMRPKTDMLFVGSKKTGITSRSVSRILKRYALAAGINKNISPHTLRHSFATHLLAADGEGSEKRDKLRAIQLMLGHSSLSSTQKYTHISVEQLMSIYDNTHPRA